MKKTVNQKPDKHQEAGKRRSLAYQTGRQPVHFHAVLFADDLEELKSIARNMAATEGRTITVNELIRDLVSDFVQTHSKHFCKVCGAVYKDKAAADACESHHNKVVDVIGRRYRPITMDESGLPHTITVRLDNGETAQYVPKPPKEEKA